MTQNFNLIDRYAQALYQVTEANGKIKQIVDDANLCSEVLLALPKYFSYLSAPVSELDMQKSVIQTLSKQYKFNNLTKNFLLMLCVNGRLNYLQQIISRFIVLCQEAQGILVADVKSAAKLTEKQLKEVAGYLEKKLGKKILLNATVDPKILGGLIIKTCSMVVDNSISNKISKFKFNTEEFIS
jgi:F-type H+-transporting ATPase subunit delta